MPHKCLLKNCFNEEEQLGGNKETYFKQETLKNSFKKFISTQDILCLNNLSIRFKVLMDFLTPFCNKIFRYITHTETNSLWNISKMEAES